MMMKRFCIFFIFSTFLSLSFFGCQRGPSLEDAEEETEKGKDRTLRQQVEDLRGVKNAVAVPVMELTTATIMAELSIKGSLVPKKSALVKPLMDGRITFLREVKVGDLVVKGEVIAKIDDRDIEDEIKQQINAIAISSETLVLDKKVHVQSEKDLVFDRQMLKEGFLNESRLRESELNLDRAEITLRQSTLRLAQEQRTLQSSLRRREKVLIEAPMSGMVVLASHLTGQQNNSSFFNEEIMALDDTLISPGTNLFGVISNEDYLAQCLVNGKDKAKVHVGQKARVTVITHMAISVPGEVTEIAYLQDAQSHAYKVWVRLDRVEESFTAGLFVRADIELECSEGAITVPKEYIKERDGRYYAQVVDKDTVRDVWVETGIREGRLVEITSGLKPHDLLVASEEEIAPEQRVEPKKIGDDEGEGAEKGAKTK